MSKMHLCLFCHSEGSVQKVAMPILLEMLDRVEQNTGERVNVTWAQSTAYRTNSISDVYEHGEPAFVTFGDLYHGLLEERGDEIGLHIHGLQDGKRMLPVDAFIEKDTQRLIDAGFPPPKSFAAGFFVFHPSTLKILEACGYEVDSSTARGRCADSAGLIYYDYPPSEWLNVARPYRPSYEDVARAGGAKIVEVPYSGHMLELTKGPDEDLFETPDEYDYHISERFRRRWQARHDFGVDVFEIFFHLHEFLGIGGGPNKALLDGAETFLSEVGSWEDVTFPTMQHAITNWKARAEPNKTHEGDA